MCCSCVGFKLLFGLLVIFLFSFFLFLLLFLLFLSLLLLLLLILDLLVLPLGRLQEALVHLLLLLLLWRGLGRPVDVNLGDAARREHAVPSRHAARQEGRGDLGGGQGEHAAPPLALGAAGGRHRLRRLDRGQRVRHGVIPVAQRAFLQLLLRVLLHQLGHGQPPLTHLGGTAGAQRAAAGRDEGAVNAGGDADHVVQAPVVLGVSGEPEAKGVLDALGDLLPGALVCRGGCHPLLELGPLGDEALTELLSLGPHVEAAEALEGLVATRLEGPVASTLPFCGVHCVCVSTCRGGDIISGNSRPFS